MTEPKSEQRPTVTHVPERHQFEIEVDGKRAGLTQYAQDAQRRVFVHTEIDDAYAGHGLAGTLVRHALDATRAEGLRIVAVCPYVAGFVEKNSDWNDLLEPVTPYVRELVREATPG
jgi:predicted GNAT family acetyltransferase